MLFFTAVFLLMHATANQDAVFFQTQVLRDMSDKIFNKTLVESIVGTSQAKVLSDVLPVLVETSHAHVLTQYILNLNCSEANLLRAQLKVSHLIESCNYAQISARQKRIYLQRSEDFVEMTPKNLCHMESTSVPSELQKKYTDVCQNVALVSSDTNTNVETSKHISAYYNLYAELRELYQSVNTADFVAFHSLVDDMSIIYPCPDNSFVSDNYQYRKDLYQQHVLQLSSVRQHFETDTILMILDGSELLSVEMLNEIKLLASIYASSISLNVNLRIAFVAYEIQVINDGGSEPLVTTLNSLLKKIQDFDPITSHLGYYVSLHSLITLITDFVGTDIKNKTTSVVYIGYGIVEDATPAISSINNLSYYSVMISDVLAENAYGKQVARNLKKHLTDFTNFMRGHIQCMDLTTLLFSAELFQEVTDLDDMITIHRILSERCSSTFYQCIKESNYTLSWRADRDVSKRCRKIVENCKSQLPPEEKSKFINCVTPSLIAPDYDLPFGSNTQGNILLNRYRHKLLIGSEFLRPEHYSIKLALVKSGWMTNETVLAMSTPVYAEFPFYGKRLMGFLVIGLRSLETSSNTNMVTLLNIDNYKIVWPGFSIEHDDRLSYFSNMNQKISEYITEYGFYRSDMIRLKELIDLQTETYRFNYNGTFQLIKGLSTSSMKLPNIFSDSESSSMIVFENYDLKYVCLRGRLCAEPDTRVGLYDILIYNGKFRAEEYPRALFRVKVIILEEYAMSTHGLLAPFDSKTMKHPFYKDPDAYPLPLDGEPLFSWIGTLISGTPSSTPYIIDPCESFKSTLCPVLGLRAYVTNEYLDAITLPTITADKATSIRCACPLLDFYSYADKIYPAAVPDKVSRPEKIFMYAMIYPSTRHKQICKSWYMDITVQRYLIQFLEGNTESSSQGVPCCGSKITLDSLPLMQVCAMEFSMVYWEFARNSYRIMASILEKILATWTMDLPAIKDNKLEILLSNAYYLPPPQIIVLLNPSLGIYLSTHYVDLLYTDLMTSLQTKYGILTSKLCRNVSAIPLTSSYSTEQINKYFSYLARVSNIHIDVPFYRVRSIFKVVLLERVDMVEERVNGIITNAHNNIDGITADVEALVINHYGVSIASSSLGYPTLKRLDENTKLRIIGSLLYHNDVLSIYDNKNFEYLVLSLAELKYKRQLNRVQQCSIDTRWTDDISKVYSEIREKDLRNIATNSFFVESKGYNEEIFLYLSLPSIFIDDVQVKQLDMPGTLLGSCSMGKMESLFTLVCLDLKTTISTQLLWERIALNKEKYLDVEKMPTTDWYHISLETYRIKSYFDWFFKPRKSMWEEYNYFESPFWLPETGYNDPIKSYCIDLIYGLDVYGYSPQFLKTKLLFFSKKAAEDVVIICTMAVVGACLLIYLISHIYLCILLTRY
ncbi:hypothetical protein GL50803_008023 [Giardia duodenalis]|uniref:Uncharacterized protein n=1 Tax=Giardia intestinalis (strain ATCC 50803 / WB clone C6) TaxID=184922 RepID=D3KHD0_GIAIC|nr:hypothetical protein GL50803_008023 [Giardia intestinalis]KAE8304918.1 hypothetical protein GL50803_008023 [Giardia intestinalis]